MPIILVSIISGIVIHAANDQKAYPANLYVGVTADGNITFSMALIDKVKDYVNLLIINNPDVVRNETSLDLICDHARDAGLSFFVYMEDPSFWHYNYNPFSWIQDAETKYGKQFLGIYLHDEPGGNQLDQGSYRQFNLNHQPPNYLYAANTYVYYTFLGLRSFIKTNLIVTSDYGLYWFDYEAGYDAIFCKFGQNRPQTTSIALCRGAAEMHNKTWGVMITWAQNNPPYVEAPNQLYQDMVTSYEAGAKYIIAFNYPETGPLGALTQDHFAAIKQFKQFVLANPQNETSNTQKIAYVMPQNYGWGLRNPNDTIWGVWPADNQSAAIWSTVNNLESQYSYNFDIIFYSGWTRAFAKQHYNTLIWSNTTRTSLIY